MIMRGHLYSTKTKVKIGKGKQKALRNTIVSQSLLTLHELILFQKSREKCVRFVKQNEWGI